MIAVFADMNSDDYLEEIYSKAVELGYMPQEVKDRQIAALTAHFEKLPEQVNRETILIDGGLVSMQLMLTARAHGYDTNPIGGYDKEKIAEVFGMDKERYVPTSCCYQSEKRQTKDMLPTVFLSKQSHNGNKVEVKLRGEGQWT